MLSSWQIAQIHAQQGQQFGAAAAYSQQLSMRMPQPYQGVGLGATGMGPGGFGAGGYNYGSGGAGYGPGNSFGNTMTSAIGGVGSAVGGVMKFGGSLAGGIAGGMIGGPVGAALGSFAGGLPGMAISHVANSFMEGAHEQSSIERTLSQFQFQNASSRTGRGFNRSDSMAIGNMVRQMERLPEMLTSFGELNRLMDKMGQMGLMQGVRDAGEFMRKFRDTTATLKDLAKVMGTTMEGALQAFGEARMGGFYSKGDITRNVLNRQIVGAVSGMSQQQIGGLQTYGAEMAHAYGGSRAGGSRNMLRTAGQLGMANQMGIISNDQIMEMTGKEGAAGIEELSGQMSQLSYKMGNSNVGQALTLALGKMENGRYTGEMDEELVERVRRGQLGLDELKSMARSKASTRGAKLSFAAHKNRLRTNMASAVGSEGIGMQLQEILGERGWQNPDANNLVMQRFGASEEQANLLQKLMPNLQGIGSQIALSGKNEQRNVAMNAAMAEHGWDAIRHRIGKKISHYTTDWAKDLGVSVRDYFQNWADDFLDDLSGRYTKNVTKRVSDEFRFGSGKISAATLSDLSKQGGIRMDVGQSGGFSGLLARGAHYLGGGETEGERMDRILAHSFGGKYLQHESGGDFGINLGFGTAADRAAAKGRVVLDSSWTGRVSSTDSKSIKEAQDRFSSGKYGEDELKQLKSIVGEKGLETLLYNYKNVMKSGELMQIGDEDKKAEFIFEEMRKSNRLGLSGLDVMRDRNGAGITNLGKLRKGGMQSNDIVAALDKATGGGAFRGSADFTKIGLTNDVFNLPGLSKHATELSRQFAKISGSDNSASGMDVKGYLEQGGLMAGLAQGFTSEQGTMMSTMGLDLITQAVALKDPSKWTPAMKAAMTAKGIKPEELAQKLSTTGGQVEVARLLNAAQKGEITSTLVDDYLKTTSRQGNAVIFKRMQDSASGIKTRLGNLTANERAELEKSGGKDVLNALANQAKALEQGDASAGAAVTEALSKIDKKSSIYNKLMGIAGEENASIASYSDSTKRSLKGVAKSSGGVDDILKAAQLGDAPKQFKEEIEKMISGGPTKGLDAKEVEAVAKRLAEVQSNHLYSKSGKEAASTQVSEQDIAKSLATMSDNAKTTAQLLADIASGNKPGTTAAGAGK